MGRVRHTRQRRGFTIIELMVAIAILLILASLTVLALGSTRRNSRDSRRKADAQTIAAGMSQYTVVAGTTFVKLGSQTCVLPDEVNPATTPDPASNRGCVGASGRSYGKMNLSSATSSGYANNAGRTYLGSIGQALKQGGYLTSMPQDPLAKTGVFTDPNAPDYILIRACILTGEQQVGSRGTLFAVWTSLENGPSAQESSNSDRYPGGKDAGPTGGADPYVYDFAAQQTEWQAGAFYLNGFAAGNGVTKVVAKEDCSPDPQATS